MLKKVRATGAGSKSRGGVIELCQGTNFFGGSWGEDGRIVFPNATGLVEVPDAGGDCKSLTHVEEQGYHRFPQILPGGRSILFTIGKDGAFDNAQIAILNRATGKYNVLVQGGTAARYLPSGHLIYVRGGSMFAVPFDLARETATGPETRVVEGVYNNAGGFANYTVSDGGLLLYTNDQRSQNMLDWVDRVGSRHALSTPSLPYGSIRISPDGNRAVTYVGPRTDIELLDLASETLSLLVSEGINLEPIWTPTAMRITFRVQGQGLYWTSSEGGLSPERLLAPDEGSRPNSWSPDGTQLLYTVQNKDVWVLPMVGAKPGSPRPLLASTAYSERDAQVSPDGKWLAYESDESGEPRIYVRSFPELQRKTAVSSGLGVTPRWPARSSELFYRDPKTNSLMAVPVQTSPQLVSGSPHTLFSLGNVPWDAAPGGQRFLVVRTPANADAQQPVNVVVNWFSELKQNVPVK